MVIALLMTDVFNLDIFGGSEKRMEIFKFSLIPSTSLIYNERSLTALLMTDVFSEG